MKRKENLKYLKKKDPEETNVLILLLLGSLKLDNANCNRIF